MAGSQKRSHNRLKVEPAASPVADWNVPCNLSQVS